MNQCFLNSGLHSLLECCDVVKAQCSNVVLVIKNFIDNQCPASINQSQYLSNRLVAVNQDAFNPGGSGGFYITFPVADEV